MKDKSLSKYETGRGTTINHGLHKKKLIYFAGEDVMSQTKGQI
jgi:hypothetical protein